MKVAALFLRFVACSVLVAAAASARAGNEVHVRGEVLSINPAMMTVKVRNGSTVTVRLPEKFDVLDTSRTTLASVRENSYIGVAAAPLGRDKVRALGIIVFPEGARGLNEGFFPWDLKKNSTMTNATVARFTKAGSANEIQVRYGDKTQTVVVDSATAVGQMVPGMRNLLVNGARVLVVGDEGSDATVTAKAVLVGRDGFLPPI